MDYDDDHYDDDEQPSADTDEYALVNSIDILFRPRPWPIYEVRVLESPEGEPLALVAVSKIAGGRKTLAELPDEFFSHQLADLDYRDPHEMAKFMSVYGWVGPTLGTLVEQRAFERELAGLDVDDAGAVNRFERRFAYAPNHHLSAYGSTQDEVREHYVSLKVAFADLAERLRSAQPDANILTEARICNIISIKHARRLFEDWLYCAQHLKALVRYRTPQELALALGEDEYAVVRNCEGAINILQSHLSKAHPVLALRDLTDGYEYTPAAERTDGSFEEALALQLWNFTLEAKGGYTVCKECGQIFVRRQSKSRKGPARSTGQFCCDRCKNRFAQREHRKTEGYRMKQERRRAAGGTGPEATD